MSFNPKVNRRTVLKGGGVILLPAFATVGTAATDSGEIELEVDAEIPNNTEAYIRVYQDNNDNGAANRQQEIEVTDGVNTYVYDALTGYEGAGYHYWMNFELISTTGENTPIINSMAFTLPTENIETGTEAELTQWYDDFSDGDVEGWLNIEQDIQPQISEESVTGNYSLFAETTELQEQDRPSFDWIDGPTLDLTQQFDIEGVVRVNWVDSIYTIRIGITGVDQGQEGENAYIVFDLENSQTALSTYDNIDENAETINTSFNNTWVNFKMESDEGSESLRAKVWEYGGTEPSEWQLESDNFTGISGEFGVNPGFAESSHRQIWLDEVTINGVRYVPGENENLILDSRKFIVTGESTPYTIRYNNPDDPESEWQDITDSVDSIESDNPEIVGINEEDNILEGSSRGETLITVNHNDIEAGYDVSVAEIKISDLHLLPPSRKIQAVFNDRASQVIFGSVGGALFVNKLITSYGEGTNSWISLGVAFAIVLLAGFQGWVSNGIVFSALFFVIIASLIISNVRQNEVSVVNQGEP